MRISSLRTSFFDRASRAVFRVRVSGESMWPELVSGRVYFATSFGRIQRGDRVVFRDPRGDSIYVKEVVAETAEGYRVTSLVPWGSSSSDFGVVAKERVLGKIL
jgi:phage repressor protein C with HTH and peptisase S24 domain